MLFFSITKNQSDFKIILKNFYKVKSFNAFWLFSKQQKILLYIWVIDNKNEWNLFQRFFSHKSKIKSTSILKDNLLSEKIVHFKEKNKSYLANTYFFKL